MARPLEPEPLHGRPVAGGVYFDHAASTPVDELAAARSAAVARVVGNPASVHSAGVWATREVERARGRVAAALGAAPEEVFFTSGATESNNLALKGVVWASARRAPHVIVSAVEHPSVLEPARWLAAAGHARLTVVGVDTHGLVDPRAVLAALTADTVLVSVQQANNETGVLQPLGDIGAQCRERGILLHVDASQGFCKVPLDVRTVPVDLITASSHKLHGPKGVGLLYVREGLELIPLLHGGGHESGVRGGTLNTPGIAGFGEAVVQYNRADIERISALRDRFELQLRRRIPSLRVHGAEAPRVATISNFAVPGVSGKALFLDLDRRGVQVSASSACHSTLLTPSPVLIAMGYSEAQANEAVRVSFGRTTTPDDVDRLLSNVCELIEEALNCR